MNDRKKRRGISLMIVTVVVAVASVLGLAILSSNTLQAEASAGQDRAVSADALAESGVNLGLYYLQNITDATKCPAGLQALGVGSPAWTQTANGLGAAVSGTFDLSITRPTTIQYVVTSLGKATSSSAATVQRTMTATVELNYYAYGINAPNMAAAGTWTIPTSTKIVGDVYSSSPVVNNGTVTGRVYSNSVSGSGTATSNNLLTNVLSTALAPVTGLVTHYFPTYTYNGSICTPGVLLLPQSNVTLGPSGLNPAGVYIAATTIDFNGGVKVNGTVVIRLGGSLKISGTGNTITPVAGMPAAIIDGDINFKATGARLDSNGLTYIGGRIVRSGGATSGILNVTGTLMAAGTNVTLDPSVVTTLTYDRYKAAVMNLTGSAPPPTSLSIVSWKNNGN